ncbi:MAG: DUF4282 domain-containing protein [Pseudomonadales bacterium]|nr:DUF4282 domain-containing protein [Pseudomonadales bacterium]
MKAKRILDDAETNVTRPASQFLGTLFDFSFSRFITIQMFPAIYGIVLATTLFGLLYLTVEAFLVSIPRGLFYLVVATPITFLGIATITRAVMEFYLVVFKIAENIDEMREVTENFSGISQTVGGVKDLTKKLPFWSIKSERQNQRENETRDTKKKRKNVDWPY